MSDAEFPLTSEPIQIYVHDDGKLYTYDHKGRPVKIHEYIPPEIETIYFAQNEKLVVPE